MADKTISIERLAELMLNFHRVFYPELVKRFREERRLTQLFRTVAAIKDRIVFSSFEVGEVAQAYQVGWTPKGQLDISPEEYMVRYMKVDKEVDPNELRQTYLADVIPGATAEENEIVRLFYKDMMTRSAEDTDRALIQGKYKAPTAGVAGSAMEMVDGLLEVTKRFVDSGKIAPFAADSMDETNTCLALRELWKELPEKYRYNPKLRCYLFNNTWDKYVESYEANYGTLQDKQDKKHIRNTQCPVQVLPHGEGSDMVLFTMEGNIRLFNNRPADAFKFEVQRDKRMLNYMQDWAAGIGYVIAGREDKPESQYVWCNEFDYLNKE
jgi:hypothetical protein